LKEQLASINNAIELLLKQKVSLSKSVDKPNSDVKNARKGLEEHKQKRKRNATSLYNIVEKILHKHGVERASYHGGDFNGVTIRKLMDGADTIMNEVFDALVEHKSDERTLSNNDIQELCTNVKLALTM